MHGTAQQIKRKKTGCPQQALLSCITALRFLMSRTAGGGKDSIEDAVMAYALGRASVCSLCCAALLASPACVISRQRLYVLKASPVKKRVGLFPMLHVPVALS